MQETPKPPVLNGAQIVMIVLIVLNTFLVLNGREQLKGDFAAIAYQASQNAAQAAVQDCRQAYSSTPTNGQEP